MNNQLPDKANLEHLKGQAKALLATFRAGDPVAVSKFAEIGKTAPRLADAQLAVARGYGFDSWAKLKRMVEGMAGRMDLFFSAIQAGDQELVALFLSTQPGLVNAKLEAEFGTTPLTLAARRNDLPMIDLLLEAGGDPNESSDWWAGGFSALDFADEPTSRYLISRGARLTAHAAARLGMADELRAILRASPEVVRARGGDGQFPLHFANTPEVVDLLLEAGADIDARDLDHEGTAAQHRIRDEAVCRRLVERGASPDVFIAVALNDTDLLESLLDADPEALYRAKNEPGNPMIPKAPGEHIYTYAFGSARLHQLALELKRREAFDVLMRRSSPALQVLGHCWSGAIGLAEAVIREHPDAIRLLAESAPGLLREAAWDHKTPAVRFLLQEGFPPDERDAEGMSPLKRAALHGYADVVEVILPYAPSLTTKNTYGGDALGTCLWGSVNSWRTDGDFVATVRLLLEAGATPPDKPSGSPAVRELLAAWTG